MSQVNGSGICPRSTGSEPGAGSGAKDLVAEAGTIITSAQGALSKRRSWAKSRREQTAARGDGKAVEIDNRVDRIVSAIYNNAQNFVRSMPADKPEAIKANKLATELFPRGAIDITHKAFEDETAAVEPDSTDD